MTNHFISGLRSRREYRDLDQMPEMGIPATQHNRAELRELNVALHCLPREQQEALRMIGIEEQSYEEAAGATGCAVGTLKSRVHRARLNLRSLIHGECRRLNVLGVDHCEQDTRNPHSPYAVAVHHPLVRQMRP